MSVPSTYLSNELVLKHLNKKHTNDILFALNVSSDEILNL